MESLSEFAINIQLENHFLSMDIEKAIDTSDCRRRCAIGSYFGTKVAINSAWRIPLDGEGIQFGLRS